MSKELINIIGQISPSPIVSTTTNTAQPFIRALPDTEVSAASPESINNMEVNKPGKCHTYYLNESNDANKNLIISWLYYCLDE